MKKLLSADLYALRRGKLFWVLLAGAAVFGFLLPGTYLFMFKMMDLLTEQTGDLFKTEELASLNGVMNMLKNMMNSDAVVLSAIPFSSGYGLFVTGAVAFFTSRQFSAGIIRNKIIAGHGRAAVFFSTFLSSLALSLPAVIVNLAATAGASVLMFGKFQTFGTAELARVFAVTVMIYVVYTAVPLCAAFTFKSVPLTIILSIVMPIALGALLSLASAAAASMPKLIMYFLCVFPSFQTTALSYIGKSNTSFITAVVADAVITAAALLGFCRLFKRSDVK